MPTLTIEHIKEGYQQQHKMPLDPEQIVNGLNAMLAVDRDAIQLLMNTHVKCNQAMAGHPTIQVSETTLGYASVGMLGILNGLCGVFKIKDSEIDQFGPVMAHFDDEGVLLRFMTTLSWAYKKVGDQG